MKILIKNIPVGKIGIMNSALTPVLIISLNEEFILFFKYFSKIPACIPSNEINRTESRCWCDTREKQFIRKNNEKTITVKRNKWRLFILNHNFLFTYFCYICFLFCFYMITFFLKLSFLIKLLSLLK